MRKMWTKLSTTAALAFMLCLTGTAFAQQCVDNGDGTVTDKGAGLMWQKATAGPMDWDAAMSYASSISLGGHSGWWLPNIDELQALYHSPCKSMMEVVPSNYWSSTTNANYTSYAWLVNFHNGYVSGSYKSLSDYVRAVRAGQ